MWSLPVLLLLVGAATGAEYGEAQLRLDTNQHRVALDFLHAANGEVLQALLVGLDLLLTFFVVAATEWAYRALRAAADRGDLRLRDKSKPDRWASTATKIGFVLAVIVACFGLLAF